MNEIRIRIRNVDEARMIEDSLREFRDALRATNVKKWVSDNQCAKMILMMNKSRKGQFSDLITIMVMIHGCGIFDR